MKRVYVDLDDCYSLLTEHAQGRWDDIDAHGKLEDFFNLVDEMFAEGVRLSEIDDYLKYEYEDIAERLGFEPYSEEELEESYIGKLNKQLSSCFNEDQYENDYDEEEEYTVQLENGQELKMYQYDNELYNEKDIIFADLKDRYDWNEISKEICDNVNARNLPAVVKITDGANQVIFDKLTQSHLNESLPKDVHYEFTINKVAEDKLELTSGESTFTIYIEPDDDLQTIRYAIEDFVDYELAADEDDSENITGTEVVGFDYNENTGKGKFEANIFFKED